MRRALAMTRLLLAWWPALCLSGFSVRAALGRLPGIGPDATQAERLRRSYALLAGSPKDGRRTPMRVLFYGQSITQQDWWVEVAAGLRAAYPEVDFTIENRAVSGHSAGRLALLVPRDIPDFNPDLIIFHAYGAEWEFVELMKAIRRVSAAGVMLQTDHLLRGVELDEPAHPTGPDSQWNAWQNLVVRPRVAAEYGAYLLDVRAAWKDYVRLNGIGPLDLLGHDGWHLNPTGNELMAAIVLAHLKGLRAPAVHDPWRNADVRSYRFGRELAWRDGRVELAFEGRRLELELAEGAPPELTARIDGRALGEWPGLYGFSRSSATHRLGWPSLVHIGNEALMEAEAWSATLHQVRSNGTYFRFDVRGSSTGEDGSGTNTLRFVSRSRRIVIEPGDWNIPDASTVSGEAPPEGFVVRWYSVANFLAGVPGRGFPAPASLAGVLLAEGIPDGSHLLTLSTAGDPTALRGIRVYSARGLASLGGGMGGGAMELVVQAAGRGAVLRWPASWGEAGVEWAGDALAPPAPWRRLEGVGWGDAGWRYWTGPGTGAGEGRAQFFRLRLP